MTSPLLRASLLSLWILLINKSIFDYTNTPNYINKLLKEIANQQSEIKKDSNNSFFNKLHDNKFKIIAGASVATLGFFAYKNNRTISNFIKENLPVIKPKLKF